MPTKKEKHSRRRQQAPDGSVLLAQRAVAALLMAFHKHGIHPDQLDQILVRALEKVRRPGAQFQIPASRDSAILGTALALWHRDTRYLDAAGRPRPLRLLGRQPSVESLLRTAGLRNQARETARRAGRSGLLIKHGRAGYLPTGRSAKIEGFDHYLAEHISNGVLRLVETAHFNFSPAGKRAPLLQRAAAVRTLPRRLRRPFREYVNQQGNAFVTNIDDWLEAHSLPPNRGTTSRRSSVTNAGVYAFAYFEK